MSSFPAKDMAPVRLGRGEPKTTMILEIDYEFALNISIARL
jgi:hypothetical protein